MEVNNLLIVNKPLSLTADGYFNIYDDYMVTLSGKFSISDLKKIIDRIYVLHELNRQEHLYE